MVLDILNVLLLCIATMLIGLAWLSRWLEPSRALLFVIITVLSKFAIVVFRYYVAIGGSEQAELTSDTYRYLSYGEALATSRDGSTWSDWGHDETGRVVIFSSLLFRALGQSWMGVYLAGALLGLIAMWVLYGAMLELPVDVSWRFGYAICLAPSVLYWSSSVGKEALTLLGLSVTMYGLVGVWKRHASAASFGPILWIVAGILCLMAFRFEMALLACVAAIGAFVAIPGLGGRVRGSGVSLSRVWFIGGVAASALLLALQFDALPFGLAENLFGRYENTSIGNAQIDVERPAGITGLLLGLPVALFRPFPWESGLGGLVSSSDTVILLAALVAAYSGLKMVAAGDYAPVVSRFLVMSSILSFGLFAALAGYGNLGLLVRMRSMAIPFAICLIAIFVSVRSQARTADPYLEGRASYKLHLCSMR